MAALTWELNDFFLHKIHFPLKDSGPGGVDRPDANLLRAPASATRLQMVESEEVAFANGSNWAAVGHLLGLNGFRGHSAATLFSAVLQ